MQTTTSTLEAIVLPPETQAHSSVIWLHGLGADGSDFVSIVPELQLPEQLGVRFIFPHAPVRPVTLNAGMPMRAWFDIHGLSLESQIDEAGLQNAYQNIHQLIQAEIAHGIPPNKIVLAGFSQGGALALYVGLQYPQRLAGIMGLSTFLAPNHPSNAQFSSENQGLPIFMAHGEYDPLVPLAMGSTVKDRLLQAKYPVEWHTYPMPHAVCPQEIHDISAWLQKILA